MNELAKLMVQSGILTPDQVLQFKKWGMQGLDPDPRDPPVEDVVNFMKEVEMALQHEDMVLVRETDFTALHNFLKKQHRGVLELSTDGKTSSVEISYGVTSTGEYLIPWMGENVADLLCNGLTFLRTDEGKTEYFFELRELYYGDVKAFIACRPAPQVPEAKSDAATTVSESPAS